MRYQQRAELVAGFLFGLLFDLEFEVIRSSETLVDCTELYGITIQNIALFIKIADMAEFWLNLTPILDLHAYFHPF
jgi:cell shape-determining protein MreD